MRTIPATINHSWVWLLLIVLGMVCLTEAGCSKKVPKYPEDHARFQRVVQAIKSLETAYVNKDGPAVHELLLPLEQLEILEAKVRQDFAQFPTIQLDLHINRIIINGDHISAFISWQGKWQRSTQEQADQARGQGVLLWSGNQVILLRGVEGDLPFGIAARLNVPS
ncbi:MAG: hypothetical protein JSU60_08010 [Nitrospirota bacterium]|nr:MAG: hypothetical protein JSU60_08010 [Nitrospirota bacterium]